jgi:hypothetical protein
MDDLETRMRKALILYAEAVAKLATVHTEIAQELGEDSEIGGKSAAVVYETEAITKKAALIAEGNAS